jgi:hypothetical protein
MASLALCAGAFAADNAPLAGTWNIAPTGRAASTGELLFRMTPGDGGDPVEVTVTVASGTNDMAVARDIRQALSTQLARGRFNVLLGEGANVLVSDPRGRPNFSLQLLDSDVENLRVDVRSVDVNASPTVPEQSVPAVPPPLRPAPGGAPGDATPPTAPPGNSGQSTSPAPANPSAPGSSPSSAVSPGGSVPAPASGGAPGTVPASAPAG